MKSEEDRLRAGAYIIKKFGKFLIDFRPDIEFCPICGRKLLVLKTDKKWLIYLDYGKFCGRMIYLYCKEHPYLPLQLDMDARLRKYVPSLLAHNRGKSPFSMDVVYFVGTSKFIQNKRREQISEELHRRFGLVVSDGTITNLSTEFIIRFYLYHQLHFDRIAHEIISGPGYILGIDGTGDGDSDRIILFIDLLRGWVLMSIDVPSEKSDYVIPYLQEIIDKLGDPLVGVSDASSGFDKAHKKVIPHVPHRNCSYHILDNIGCALFKENYYSLSDLLKNRPCTVTYLKRLRKEMRQKSENKNIPVRKYALDARSMRNVVGIPIRDMIFSQIYDNISWILRYHEGNKGMRFPFALPRHNFYKRCVEGYRGIKELCQGAWDAKWSPKFLRELELKLKETVEGIDERSIKIRKLAKKLTTDFEHFNELREILDMSSDKGDIPRDQLIIKNNEKIQKMKKKLENYEKKMKKLAEQGDDSARITCHYIEKYLDSLTMGNIVVEVNGEKILVEIPRTNSLLEVSFGSLKSDIRKRTGKTDTGQVLKRYNKYLGILQNLKSETYIKHMFGSSDKIPGALAGIPKELIDKEMKAFHEAAHGYDITNNGCRCERISFEDIMKGVKYVHRGVEESMMAYESYRPELYGRTSWDRYYFQKPDYFNSQIHS